MAAQPDFSAQPDRALTDDNAVNRTVGAAVRRLRRDRRLSQGQVAAALGVSAQQVQKYERDGASLNPARLYRLAAMFGVGIDELFTAAPLATDRDNAEADLIRHLGCYISLTGAERRAVQALADRLSRQGPVKDGAPVGVPTADDRHADRPLADTADRD